MTKATTGEISRATSNALLTAKRANAILIAGRPLLVKPQALLNEDPRHG